MKFKSTWQGSRVPKEVTLPDETVETVQYMRDGICLFMSQHNATYERIGDHEAEFTMIESYGQAKEAVANYQATQQKAQRIVGKSAASDSESTPTPQPLT